MRLETKAKAALHRAILDARREKCCLVCCDGNHASALLSEISTNRTKLQNVSVSVEMEENDRFIFIFNGTATPL